MFRPALVFVLAAATVALAQPGAIQRGKVVRSNPDGPSLTLSVEGKDREFFLTPDTKFLNLDGKTTADRLRRLKAGDDVMFKAAEQNGKGVLVVLKAGGPPQPAPPTFDASKLRPLNDLTAEKYQGHVRGLYPGGTNDRPAAHEKAGLELARRVRPLNAAGQPDAAGKVVLLSVGMSNTSQVSETFGRLLAKDDGRNPALVFVNGAQGGMTARAIRYPKDNATGTRYWGTIDDRLKAAGVTAAQVQAVWMKQADAGPREGFPAYAETLCDEMEDIARTVGERFPNARLMYLSSRTYGGYATTGLNPEPYAFESGFAVRWLIQRQLDGKGGLNFDPAKGPVRAPWLAWGPYLWASGTTKNAAGLSYERADFAPDGTHPAPPGQQKVAAEMLRFFRTDPTTRPWFLARGP
ncbi:MAG TPA: hypothetical protein VD866_27235 [Urbifossiella sp.]|nr:hypothetical protein [Urbifossiella sp.]